MKRLSESELKVIADEIRRDLEEVENETAGRRVFVDREMRRLRGRLKEVFGHISATEGFKL